MKNERASFKNTDERSLKRSKTVQTKMTQAQKQAASKKKKQESRAARKLREAEERRLAAQKWQEAEERHCAALDSEIDAKTAAKTQS